MLTRTDNTPKNNKNGGHPSAIQRDKLLKEYTKNERGLKSELQQLELAKKHYELSCRQDIKKVLVRYTNRIAKHHFYFDSKRQNANSSINLVASANENQSTFAPSRMSSRVVSAHENLKNFSNKLEPKIERKDDKMSPPLVVSIKFEPQAMSKAKKTVSWNSASLNQMDFLEDNLKKPVSKNIGDNSRIKTA